MRNEVQMWVVRNLFGKSERGVLAAPPEATQWLPSDPTRSAYIPIGANVPEYRGNPRFSAGRTPKTIAVFSVTGGDIRSQEVEDIVLAIRRVTDRIGPVRLEVFGRGADEARESLERGLEGSDVELTIRGVIPAEEITRTLSAAHALLSVRGLVTARRGTAIAGIACGLPVVGYGRIGSDPAIDAAGVRLVPWRDSEELSNELIEILTDKNLWQELHERSVRALGRYFSWDAVADQYVKLLAAKDGLR
jgi:glycosyltransferase involved in cell wall biosynthesis